MKTLALVLALALAAPAWGADDAPVAAPATPGMTCIPDAQRIAEGKAVVNLTAQVESLKAAPQGVPLGLVILISVAAALAGGGITYGVVKATTPHP